MPVSWGIEEDVGGQSSSEMSACLPSTNHGNLFYLAPER